MLELWRKSRFPQAKEPRKAMQTQKAVAAGCYLVVGLKSPHTRREEKLTAEKI